jgi:hypothetical protein
MGPTFRLAIEIGSGNYEAYSTIKISNTKEVMPESFESPHVVHPTTLDGILQMVLPACTPPGIMNTEVKVPRFIENVFVSNNIPREPGTKLHGYSHTTGSPKDAVGTVIVSDGTWKEPLVTLEGCKLVDMQNMSAATPRASEKALPSHSGYPCWGIDIGSLSNEAAKTLLAPDKSIFSDTGSNIIRDLELAAFIMCKRILRKFSHLDAQSFKPHLRLFYEYMQHQYDLAKEGDLPCQDRDVDWLMTDDSYDEEVMMRVATATVDGKLVCKVADNLEAIFLGEVEPLQVLMEDGLLTEFYRTAIGNERIFASVGEYVKHLSHLKPLRILEVGAGTGGTTKVVLNALGNHQQASSRLKSYTFTDISSGFFEAAARDFDEWSSFLEYKVVNIENDPSQQGIGAGAYDLVLATNVLHATSSVGACLWHCKSVLKP